MIVTSKTLKVLNVSPWQIDLFEKTFGNEVKVEVNEENLLRAVEAGLNIEWWGLRAFPDVPKEYYQERDALRTEYDQQVDALRMESDKEVNALWSGSGTQVNALRKRSCEGVTVE